LEEASYGGERMDTAVRGRLKEAIAGLDRALQETKSEDWPSRRIFDSVQECIRALASAVRFLEERDLRKGHGG
jgi:hypothetical protein